MALKRVVRWGFQALKLRPYGAIQICLLFRPHHYEQCHEMRRIVIPDNVCHFHDHDKNAEPIEISFEV